MKDQISRWYSAIDWFDNQPHQWLAALGIAVGVVLVLRLVVAWLTGKMRRVADKTETRLDDAWVDVLEATKWFSYLALGVTVGRSVVTIPDGPSDIVETILLVLAGLQVVFWAQAAVGAAIEVWTARDEGRSSRTAGAAIRFIARLAIWSTFVLVVLSTLGVELTSVVAGLGVGGVAAALAVQSILGDLFAGLSMYFDRPFDIGDFVIVGDVLGTVRKIGLRTTRIDSLGGEEIIYPNGALVKATIRNYQRMRERRIVFAFGIEYGVGASKVEKARDLAEQIIREKEGVRFDRAHFKQYGAYSLDFEVVYYVLSPDYNLYMQHQHEINVALYRRFEEAQIPFAFPTHTVHLHAADRNGSGAPASSG